MSPMRWLSDALEAVKKWWSGDGDDRGFEAGVSNRLTAGWITRPLNADELVRRHLDRLRARSRDLVRNNGFGVRFIRMVQRNVVGRRGVQLRAQNTDEDGEPLEEANRAIEREWKRWGEPENAHVAGKLSWRDIEKTVIGAVAGDGEAFVRMVPAFENSEHRFAVDLIDPDLVPHQLNRKRSKDPRTGKVQNEIRMGVEVDKWGRPVAYHVTDRNRRGQVEAPTAVETERIPADQVIHLFVPLPGRVNVTRGVPWFTPVLLDMKMHDGYTEAELVAARAAAAKMGFFESETGESGWTGPSAEEGTGEHDFQIEAEPGTFEQLPPGMKFSSWDPQHPNTAFGEFTKGVLRSVAAGLDVSYNALANDLEGVNFSSLRDGRQEERDAWSDIQEWLVMHLHRRVYRKWLRFAILSGRLDVDDVRASRFEDVSWLPRGWEWVDPLKEIKAEILALENGLTSRQRIAAERGDDFQEILEEIAREEAMADAAGVDFVKLSELIMTDGDPGGGGGRARALLRTLMTEEEHGGPEQEPRRNGSGDDHAASSVPGRYPGAG